MPIYASVSIIEPPKIKIRKDRQRKMTKNRKMVIDEAKAKIAASENRIVL